MSSKTKQSTPAPKSGSTPRRQGKYSDKEYEAVIYRFFSIGGFRDKPKKGVSKDIYEDLPEEGTILKEEDVKYMLSHKIPNTTKEELKGSEIAFLLDEFSRVVDLKETELRNEAEDVKKLVKTLLENSKKIQSSESQAEVFYNIVDQLAQKEQQVKEKFITWWKFVKYFWKEEGKLPSFVEDCWKKKIDEEKKENIEKIKHLLSIPLDSVVSEVVRDAVLLNIMKESFSLMSLEGQEKAKDFLKEKIEEDDTPASQMSIKKDDTPTSP